MNSTTKIYVHVVTKQFHCHLKWFQYLSSVSQELSNDCLFCVQVCVDDVHNVQVYTYVDIFVCLFVGSQCLLLGQLPWVRKAFHCDELLLCWTEAGQSEPHFLLKFCGLYSREFKVCWAVYFWMLWTTMSSVNSLDTVSCNW